MGSNTSKQPRFENKYQDATLARPMYKRFKKLLQEGVRTTDYQISLNGERFYVHKEVVERNAYVKFLMDNYKSAVESTDIKCPDMKRDSFLEILNYLYTGKIAINEYNLEDVFFASQFIWAVGVMEHCLSFIRDDTNVSNVVYKLNVTVKHDDEELNELLLQFIRPRFEQFVADKSFLLCAPKTMAVLLQNSDLRVYDEETVFKAYYRWIDHNYSIRKAFTNDLFSRIRIRYMEMNAITESKSYLNCEIHTELKKTLTRDVSQQALLVPPQLDAHGAPNIRDVTRDYWNGIYFLTRNSGLVHCSPEDKSLHKVAASDIGTTSPPRTVVVGGRIYFFSSNTHIVMCYNVVSQVWGVPARMLEKHQSCDVFAHRGSIYLFSHSRGLIERSLQVYSPESNTWSLLPCFSYLRKHRGNIKAVSMGRNLLLYELSPTGVLSACLFDPSTWKASPFNLSTQLPNGFYFQMIEFNNNLIFFAFLSSSMEMILIWYNLKKQRYTVFKIREVFEELLMGNKTEQEMCDYLRSDMKIIRHRNFVYFIENSKLLLGGENRLFVMKRVNLDNFLQNSTTKRPNEMEIEKISINEYYDILSIVSV